MTLLPDSQQPGRRPDEAQDAFEHETFEPSHRPSRPGRRRTKRGLIWRGTKMVLGAPITALSLGQIIQNGRLICGLISDLKRGPLPVQAVPVDLHGKLDFAATAVAYELSERELEARLARRRGQTATMAYLAFALGCTFIGLWFWRLLELDGTGLRLLAGLQFAPFCLVFFLAAFQQAHVNWQLRTGRLGSAGEYLRSADPFWPRR
jgi:hypothetical protein